MSNTEWKNGYEEGFAAGWKAAKAELNYTNFPPVYYGGYKPGETGNYHITQFGVMPTGSYSQTMADTSYNINTNSDYGTVTLTETKSKKPDLKVIRNLTDHTRIV